MRRKVTITQAIPGGDHVYSIRRGRTFELLGTLVAREPRYRNGRFTGWDVRFEHDGQTTYRGFAGGATVVSYTDRKESDVTPTTTPPTVVDPQPTCAGCGVTITAGGYDSISRDYWCQGCGGTGVPRPRPRRARA